MNRETNLIDLNCDMGEGQETDAAIMSYISSANIACGYHAGDEDTIAKTIDLCLQHNVAIGAHPGFDDKVNFGRKEMVMEEAALYDLVAVQVRLVKEIAERKGGRLHHVKAHGALYNMAAVNRKYAAALVQAVRDIDASLVFYGLSNSVMTTVANEAGLRPAAEVFADRAYLEDGQLVPRSQDGALITDPDLAVKQVLQFVREGTVRTLSGIVIPLPADTVCLHGDGSHALAFAALISGGLKKEGITIRPLN